MLGLFVFSRITYIVYENNIPSKFGVSTPDYARLRVLLWGARVSVHDSVLTALLMGGGGVLVGKLCNSLFNSLISVFIDYDQYEYRGKSKIKKIRGSFPWK